MGTRPKTLKTRKKKEKKINRLGESLIRQTTSIAKEIKGQL